jgi:hypothetical protein
MATMRIFCLAYDLTAVINGATGKFHVVLGTEIYACTLCLKYCLQFNNCTYCDAKTLKLCLINLVYRLLHNLHSNNTFSQI